MASATLGQQGRRIAASSQDQGQVSHAGQIPLQLPPPATQLDTLVGYSLRAKNHEVSGNWTATIPLQLPHTNYDWPNVGLLRGVNYEASMNGTVRIPTQNPPPPMAMPEHGQLTGHVFDVGGTPSAYIPLQTPARPMDMPAIGYLQGKNLDPQRNWTAYVPLQLPAPGIDLPTLGRLRAKNHDQDVKPTVYQSAITCVTYAVAANGDDATWYSNGSFDSTSLEFGHDGALTVNAFFRFTNVAVPQGATVASGSVTPFDLNGFGSNVLLRIKAVAEDNATAPTTAADANGRAVTTASVAWTGTTWNASGSGKASPDIAAVVQEVVNRAGWVSGNSIVIYVLDDGSGTNTFGNPYSYEQESAPHSHAAQLSVCYTVVAASNPVFAIDLPSIGRTRAKLLDHGGSPTLYVPLQLPARPADLQPDRANRRQSPDTSFNGSVYIPLQTPAHPSDTGTTLRRFIRVPDAQGNVTIYAIGISAQPPTPADLATIHRARIQAPDFQTNGSLYLPATTVFPATPYDATISLPAYDEVLMLPVYTATNDLPVYYTIRKL